MNFDHQKRKFNAPKNAIRDNAASARFAFFKRHGRLPGAPILCEWEKPWLRFAPFDGPQPSVDEHAEWLAEFYRPVKHDRRLGKHAPRPKIGARSKRRAVA